MGPCWAPSRNLATTLSPNLYIVLLSSPGPRARTKGESFLTSHIPKRFALKDQVDRSRFDGDLFSLWFLSIDNIVRKNCSHGDDAVIAKIDVAGAFCNLHVDPADALKLGISWGNDVYTDVEVAFVWVHGSLAF